MNLIAKVKAQGLDAYVSPTIPFIPPVGPTSPVGTIVTPVPSVPYIMIESSFNSVTPGQKFTVQVKVHTQGTPIQGFKFLINYDPALLRVVDADSDTAGMQINYLNTFFSDDQHLVEETEDNGDIFIVASATETTTISDISVAIVEFEAVGEGFAEVTVVKDESALVTANSTDILEHTNSLDFIISESTTLPTNTPTEQNGTIYPSIIPGSALDDVIGTKGSIIVGALLVSVGILIIKSIKNAKLQR